MSTTNRHLVASYLGRRTEVTSTKAIASLGVVVAPVSDTGRTPLDAMASRAPDTGRTPLDAMASRAPDTGRTPLDAMASRR